MGPQNRSKQSKTLTETEVPVYNKTHLRVSSKIIRPVFTVAFGCQHRSVRHSANRRETKPPLGPETPPPVYNLAPSLKMLVEEVEVK